MKLGEKIAKLRAGGSYAEVARVADCSTPTIRDIESGATANPGIMLCAKIAKHYGVSLDWLVDETQGWPPPATTLEDKVVQAVHNALTPYAKIEGLSFDDQKLINGLREHGICGRIDSYSDDVYDAMEAILDVWGSAKEVGTIEEYSNNADNSHTDAPPDDEIDKALRGRKGEVG